MARPPPPTQLSPRFCFSPSALKDFLRVSRSAIDDPIAQHLNALYTPSHAPMDASSTARRPARPAPRLVDSAACHDFRDHVLLPSWHARSQALSYCAVVASRADPDEPEAAVLPAETESNHGKVVDDRLDPYASRSFPHEPRTERLAELVRREQGIEDVVRTRTWAVVRGRCSESVDSWEEALAEWGTRKNAGAGIRAEREG